MTYFVRKPSVDLYAGIKVDKDTTLEYHNDKVDQTLENLVLHTILRVKGEGYESTYDTILHLQEGDILIYEEEGRGYIKPVEHFVTIDEAAEDLVSLKGMGD